MGTLTMSTWIRAALLGLAAFAAFAPSPASAAAKASRKDLNVVLITLDTTRRDHLGCYGYKGVETPNLDWIANQGVQFMNATSPVPLTCPAHSTMLTGVFPPVHGVRSNGGFSLKPESVTLQEILKDHGYRTGAFISAYVLNRVFGVSQGFDEYDDDLKGGAESIQEGMFTAKERKGEVTVARAIDWLRKGPAEQKFFLWVHFYDPHAPYNPAPEYRKKYPGSLYTAEIAYMDAQVGKLLDELRATGVIDRTLIVAAGDHGESLGEHEEQSHAFFLYDSTIRVPFMIRTPGTTDLKVPSGQQLDGQVRLVDIMPTVLSALEIPAPDGIQGATLLPYMVEKKDVPDLDLYCETLLTRLDYGWSDLIGVRTARWKYIDAPRRELYDLERDPWEIDNLAEQFPDRVADMREKLGELLKGGSGVPANAFASMTMDEEMKRSLQSLGYLGGSAPEAAPAEAKSDSLGIREPVGRDPKDMVAVFTPITKAMQAMFKNDLDEAIKYLSRALAIEPENKQANRYMGDCYKQKNLLGKAEEYYQRTLAIDPRQGQVLNNYGALCIDLERYDEAFDLLKRAVEVLPTSPDAQNNLGVVLLQRDEVDEALKAFERAVKLDAEMVEARMNLANCYGKQGRWPETIRELETVLKDQPNNTAAKRALIQAKRISASGGGAATGAAGAGGGTGR